VNLNSITVEEDANGLTLQAVIAMYDGINHCLAQGLQRIFRFVDAFEPDDLCTDLNVELEELAALSINSGKVPVRFSRLTYFRTPSRSA
jgi:hypothetical protein